MACPAPPRTSGHREGAGNEQQLGLLFECQFLIQLREPDVVAGAESQPTRGAVTRHDLGRGCRRHVGEAGERRGWGVGAAGASWLMPSRMRQDSCLTPRDELQSSRAGVPTPKSAQAGLPVRPAWPEAREHLGRAGPLTRSSPPSLHPRTCVPGAVNLLSIRMGPLGTSTSNR